MSNPTVHPAPLFNSYSAASDASKSSGVHCGFSLPAWSSATAARAGAAPDRWQVGVAQAFTGAVLSVWEFKRKSDAHRAVLAELRSFNDPSRPHIDTARREAEKLAYESRSAKCARASAWEEAEREALRSAA